MGKYYDYFPESKPQRRFDRFAVVIFLPSHLDEIIAPLREKFDPIYNLVASHITLVFPFESDRSLEELTAVIAAETKNQNSILIELNTIGDYYPRFPVIYWNVKKNEDLSNLYYRLYSRLELPIPHKEYQPHVSVAREISNHRVMLVKEKIVSYLPNERFYTNKVDLITPLGESKWVSVRTFPLSEPERPLSL